MCINIHEHSYSYTYANLHIYTHNYTHTHIQTYKQAYPCSSIVFYNNEPCVTTTLCWNATYTDDLFSMFTTWQQACIKPPLCDTSPQRLYLFNSDEDQQLPAMLHANRHHVTKQKKKKKKKKKDCTQKKKMGELNSEGECPPACLNGDASDGAKTVEQRWGMLIVFTQYLRRLELEITISEFKAKLIFKNYSNSSDENSSNESGLAYREKIRSVLR